MARYRQGLYPKFPGGERRLSCIREICRPSPQAKPLKGVKVKRLSPAWNAACGTQEKSRYFAALRVRPPPLSVHRLFFANRTINAAALVPAKITQRNGRRHGQKGVLTDLVPRRSAIPLVVRRLIERRLQSVGSAIAAPVELHHMIVKSAHLPTLGLVTENR